MQPLRTRDDQALNDRSIRVFAGLRRSIPEDAYFREEEEPDQAASESCRQRSTLGHSISSRRVGRGGAGFRRADAVRRRRFARPREPCL